MKKIKKKIKITCLFVKGKVMGIFPENTSLPEKYWWDDERTVKVPKDEYDKGIVNGGNIHKFFR